MSNEKLTYQDLLQIVELIKSASHFGKFHLKTGELELDLSRGTDMDDVPARISLPPNPVAAPITTAPAALSQEETEKKQRHGHVGGGEVVLEGQENAAPARNIPAQGTTPPLHTESQAYPPGAVIITSPMVGTFYRAPEPGAQPFVEVGQLVEASSTVCIIEVMKLINSIPAGHKGVVTHILVQDGEPVEYGQHLMVIEPRE